MVSVRMVSVLEASAVAELPLEASVVAELPHGNPASSLSVFPSLSHSLTQSLSLSLSLSSRARSLARSLARSRSFSLLPCNLVQDGAATPAPEAKVLTRLRS